jgi:hypothetical protein
MPIALARSFAIENDWYWRISENAKTFCAAAAVSDFLKPLARLAKDSFAISDLVAEGASVRFMLGTEPVAIPIETNLADRAALNQFVLQVTRPLAATRHAFAIVSPRRYELRGALVTEEELATLAATSDLLMPLRRTRSPRGA